MTRAKLILKLFFEYSSFNSYQLAKLVPCNPAYVRAVIRRNNLSFRNRRMRNVE